MAPTTVCAVDPAYLIVPPHVLPEGMGVAPVFAVLIVPLFVIVAKVPLSVLVPMSSVPLAVVVSVPLTTRPPAAVLVPLVLLNDKLL